MTSDLDIYRAANIIVTLHGEDARSRPIPPLANTKDQ